MARIFRQLYTQPIPSDAEPLTHEGKPAVRFKGKDGKWVIGIIATDPGRCRIRSKVWQAEYLDKDGIKRTKSLETASKDSAQRMLNEILKRVDQEKAGVRLPSESHAKATLAEHLDDWRKALADGGCSAKHVSHSVQRVRRLCEDCGTIYLRDLVAADCMAAIAAMQLANGQALPVGEEFTLGELTRILGVSKDAVRKAVRAGRLAATGSGSARRFPRATLEALASRRRGASQATANHHLTALKMFGNWLVSENRLPANPFTHLSTSSAEVDRRHERSFLTADEVKKLLATTEASENVFRGLRGQERARLYLLAVVTGYRAGELATIVPESFDFTGLHPLVRLPHKNTKNRKGAETPLVPDVAEMLRAYLADKPQGEPVWPGTWNEKAAEMLRQDLAAANIPLTKEGRVIDFHALRSTCGLLAEAGGATLREVMTLMRHSDPKLTLKTYGRLGTSDMAKTVGKMPNLLTEVIPVLPSPLLSLTVPLTVFGDSERVPVIAKDDWQAKEKKENPLENSGFGEKVLVNSSVDEVKALGIEPRTNGLKVRCSTTTTPLQHNALGDSPATLTVPLTVGMAVDPDLLAIAQAWDKMPENMKDVIRSMAKMVGGQPAKTESTGDEGDKLPWEEKKGKPSL